MPRRTPSETPALPAGVGTSAGRRPGSRAGGAAAGALRPITGWVAPLACPACASGRLLQVDLVECVYPVRGQRRPWGLVLLDVAAAETDESAIHGQLFRCADCAHEWPVPRATRFMPAERGAP